MPIRPRGDPEVLVVRGKPTGPTGSLLHDRASLYSSTHFFNFTKKNKTKTKQNFVYRFSKSVNKTADKSQKDNECVSNLQQYNFFASKIENQKRKKLHEAMPPQIVLVNKQLILMCLTRIIINKYTLPPTLIFTLHSFSFFFQMSWRANSNKILAIFCIFS